MKQIKILFIDDNEKFGQQIVDFLNGRKFDPGIKPRFIFYNETKIIPHILNANFDLIITDILMYGDLYRGQDFIIELREAGYKGKIIAYTSYFKLNFPNHCMPVDVVEKNGYFDSVGEIVKLINKYFAPVATS